MKKIYSPLLEALLALYLGFEWIQVCITTSLQLLGNVYTECFYLTKFGGMCATDRQHSGTYHNTRDILVRGIGSRPLEDTQPSAETTSESSPAESSGEIFEEAVKPTPELVYIVVFQVLAVFKYITHILSFVEVLYMRN